MTTCGNIINMIRLMRIHRQLLHKILTKLICFPYKGNPAHQHNLSTLQIEIWACEACDTTSDTSWGGDLSSRIRASDFVVSIHNVAVVCAFEPLDGR